MELDACLDIDEVAPLMVAASRGRMREFVENSAKRTDGEEDLDGMRYSHHNWKGRVLPSTGSGLGRHVTIGITDYEFFAQKASDRKWCGRREGHRYFFALGPKMAVDAVVDHGLVVHGVLARAIRSPNMCNRASNRGDFGKGTVGIENRARIQTHYIQRRERQQNGRHSCLRRLPEIIGCRERVA